MIKNRVFVVMLLLLVLALLANAYFNSDDIYELEEAVPSPDGKFVAYKFLGGGGATNGWSYHLSIETKGDPFKNEDGNVFVSYSDDFYFEWKGNKELIIFCSTGDKLLNTTKIHGIDIRIEHW